MTKASYAGEELIGSLGPHEGLRRFVVHGQIVVDRVPEVARAAMDAAPQLLLGEQHEPALNQIDPGGTLRREMQMIAGTLRKPSLNQGRLVGRVVVDNQMDVQVLGDGSVDRVQELPKLDGAVPAIALANHRSGCRVPRRARSYRGAHSRGPAAPLARDASATAADCGPALGFAPFHRRTTPGPCPAGSDTGRRCPAPCR